MHHMPIPSRTSTSSIPTLHLPNPLLTLPPPSADMIAELRRFEPEISNCDGNYTWNSKENLYLQLAMNSPPQKKHLSVVNLDTTVHETKIRKEKHHIGGCIWFLSWKGGFCNKQVLVWGCML